MVSIGYDMNYYEYIGSSEWKAKRQERLQIDDYQCVVCKSTDGLQVHHLHYETLGNEDARFDLITVCQRCHHWFDAIERYSRYERRVHVPNVIVQEIPERQNVKHGMENSILPVDLSLSDDRSQWADSRPTKRYGEKVEASIIEARQDRCRL